MPLIRRFGAGVGRTLMPHQKRALEYSLRITHPAFLAEMRLGKTLIAIRWIQRLDLRTVIVIAPVSVLEAWERELRLEGERFITSHGLTREQREKALETVWSASSRRFLLMSYETLLCQGEVIVRGKQRPKRVRQVPDIAYLPWDAVLLDESPKIRNPQAQITRVCCEGFRAARYRAILTGLPAPESPLDLFSQFRFLTGSFLGHGNFWSFRVAYFQKDFSGYGWVPKPGTRALIKDILHRRAFVCSRFRARMPDQFVYERRYVEMEPAQKRLYKQIYREFAAGEGGDRIETKWALTRLLWLQRVAGGFDPSNLSREPLSLEKTTEIIRLLRGELTGQSLVVWFKFFAELTMCRDVLQREGFRLVEIHRGVSRDERKRRLASFQAGKAQLLLATEKCAKFGIDCSRADAAVYYSNEPSNEDRLQSRDRILSVSKPHPLLIIDLITRGTVDEDIAESIHEKGFNAKYLMARMRGRMRK